MASLLNGFFTTEKLEEIVKVLKSKGEKGFKFTCAISDEGDKYGQNVKFYAEQSQQERDDKKPKYYFGNGKVFWTDGKITAIKKESNQTVTNKEVTKETTKVESSDLPF